MWLYVNTKSEKSCFNMREIFLKGTIEDTKMFIAKLLIWNNVLTFLKYFRIDKIYFNDMNVFT